MRFHFGAETATEALRGQMTSLLYSAIFLNERGRIRPSVLCGQSKLLVQWREGTIVFTCHKRNYCICFSIIRLLKPM